MGGWVGLWSLLRHVQNPLLHLIYVLWGQTTDNLSRLWTRLFRPVSDNISRFIPKANSFSFDVFSLVFRLTKGNISGFRQIITNKLVGKLQPSVFYKMFQLETPIEYMRQEDMAYYLCERTLFIAMTKICQCWNVPLLTVLEHASFNFNSQFCCFFKKYYN